MDIQISVTEMAPFTEMGSEEIEGILEMQLSLILDMLTLRYPRDRQVAISSSQQAA